MTSKFQDERVLNTEYPKDVVHFDQHLPIGDINQKVNLHDCIEVQLVMVAYNLNIIVSSSTYDPYFCLCRSRVHTNSSFGYMTTSMKNIKLCPPTCS